MLHRKLLEDRTARSLWIGVLLVMFLCREAFAIVGQAEGFDKFKEQDLEEFHENLVNEENKEQLDRSDEIQKILKQKKKQTAKADGKGKELATEEMQQLEEELLGLPKRDRFRMSLDGQFVYDSNIGRRQLRQEKGDSVFDTRNNFQFDLSGRKTDLRFEIEAGKQWNWHFPEKDFWTAEERLRYRRKYFKKITHSTNSRLTRTSSKTTEIDDNKVRWDSKQNMTMNYIFSPKLSINNDLNTTKRLFTQEAFDQDSSWEVSAAPSAFWNFTPKSRISAGYSFGANRIRTKTGDSNSHGIHASYFGKITSKSSASFDVAYSRQVPRSLDTATARTITTGLGYIYQWTPKTQATFQVTRGVQNTTSNIVPTEVTVAAGTEEDAGPQVTKLDTYSTNEGVSLSLNTRLTRKISTILTLNVTHARTKAEQLPPAEDIKARTFIFPTSLVVTYIITRWARLRMSYTFAYRTGNEKLDSFRSHDLMLGMSLTF